MVAPSMAPILAEYRRGVASYRVGASGADEAHEVVDDLVGRDVLALAGGRGP